MKKGTWVLFLTALLLTTALCFCAAADELILPASLKEIPEYAFAGDTSIVNVVIPKSVTSIGKGAFEGCTNLETVQFGEGLKTIGEAAFKNCTSLRDAGSIEDAKGLETIGNYAFENCAALSGFFLPDNIQSIGYDAFKGTFREVHSSEFRPMLNANTQTMQAALASFVHYDIWFDDYHLFVDKMPENMEFPGSLAVTNSFTFEKDGAETKPTVIEIPEGFEAIANGAIGNPEGGFNSLREVKLPASLTKLGSGAFENCTALETVNLENIQYIGEAAFKNCTSLKDIQSIENAKGLEEIGNYAFENCAALNGFYLPDNIQVIGFDAFKGTFTEVHSNEFRPMLNANTRTMHAALASFVHYDIWFDDYHLFVDIMPENMEFPGSLAVTNSFTFEKDGAETKPTVIEIPEGFEAISNGAIGGMITVREVKLPATLTKLGSWAFENCTALETVNLENIQYIGEATFKNCVSLKDIALSDHLESIGDYAFENCTSLNELSVPDNVQAIGYSAFNGTFNNLRPHVNANTPAMDAALRSFCHYDFWYDDYHLWIDNLVGDQPYSGYLCVTNSFTYFKDGAETRPTVIEIPNGIECIYTGAIGNPEGGLDTLREVRLPASVGIIADGGFEDCTGLQTINLEHVFVIGDNAFKNCRSMGEITLGQATGDVEMDGGYKGIGGNAFEGCTSLSLRVVEGTYAESYAKEHNIPYTTYTVE